MITFELDVGVDLEQPLDIFMALFETDSRLSRSLLLSELYSMNPKSFLDLFLDF